MPSGHSVYWALAGVALLFSCPACQPDIGDACKLHSDCSQTGDRICEPNFPGGYCTIFNCEPGSCPSEAVCVAFYSEPSEKLVCADPTERRFQRTFCMKNCSSTSDCRSGYSCVDYSSPDNAITAVVVEHGSYNGRVCTLPPPDPSTGADAGGATVCTPSADASFPPIPGTEDAGSNGMAPRDASRSDGAPEDAAPRDVGGG